MLLFLRGLAVGSIYPLVSGSKPWFDTSCLGAAISLGIQDKVGDFSGLTPDKLLLETEKALSVERLYQSHLKLIDMQESVS